MLPFHEGSIFALSDVGKIRKLYKITLPHAGGKGGKKRGGRPTNGVNVGRDDDGSVAPAVLAEERAEMEAVILGIMAMKGS